ncbi:hypothetical protein [Azospirillum doebereinerae]
MDHCWRRYRRVGFWLQRCAVRFQPAKAGKGTGRAPEGWCRGGLASEWNTHVFKRMAVYTRVFTPFESYRFQCYKSLTDNPMSRLGH